jgi:hypothetical protein
LSRLLWPSLTLTEDELRLNETIFCLTCGMFFGPKMSWENLVTFCQ